MRCSFSSVSSVSTYLLTYSMKQSPSWEANRFSASQVIPRTLWKRRFITTFTSVRQLSLSWARSNQSMPSDPTSLRSILILSSHLSRGLPSVFFPSGFTTKTLYTHLLSPVHAPPISFFSISTHIKQNILPVVVLLFTLTFPNTIEKASYIMQDIFDNAGAYLQVLRITKLFAI